MSSATHPLRRTVSVGAAGALMAVLTACTGRGGGYLPPDAPVFGGQASFGFDFSCQDPGGINPPTGRLQIQLDYTDHGTNPLGGRFTVHGIVDEVDPVLESEICIGKNPPPAGSTLTFLGRYRTTTSAAPGPLAACATRQKSATPWCRFEVTVKDNDGNLAPSRGDFFSIMLSSSTCDPSTQGPACSTLPDDSVFYTRAGVLQGGNITVN